MVKKLNDNQHNSIWQGFYRPYIGIPLLLIGLVLVISPYLSDAYANYRQKELMEQANADLQNPSRMLDKIFSDGVSTGFENVIIRIPRLGLEAVVLPPADVYTVSKYDALLRRGPVFITGSRRPGAIGNVMITGHRTSYGAYFRDLDFLEKGDEIILETSGFIIVYEFKESMITEDDCWDLLLDHSDLRRLVLHTCEPKFRSPLPSGQRFIVRAKMTRLERKPAENIVNPAS